MSVFAISWGGAIPRSVVTALGRMLGRVGFTRPIAAGRWGERPRHDRSTTGTAVCAGAPSAPRPATPPPAPLGDD